MFCFYGGNERNKSVPAGQALILKQLFHDDLNLTCFVAILNLEKVQSGRKITDTHYMAAGVVKLGRMNQSARHIGN